MSEKNVSHTKWMKRAIFLASLGKNTTSPNPKVGAVILDKNGNLMDYWQNKKNKEFFELAIKRALDHEI